LVRAEELTRGVWVLQGDEGRNSGLVLSGDEAMLIDPTGSAEELAEVERILDETGQKLTSVVATSNAPAGEAYLTRWPGLKRSSPADLAEEIGLVGGWEATTFGRPRVTGALVYNPRKRVLFSGGALSGSGIPSLAGGSQGYINALEKARGMQAKAAVPRVGSIAHGARIVRQRIESDLSYMHSLRRHVITCIVAAVPFSRAMTVAESVYEEYPFLQTHLDNLRYVWDELSEREA
jgi:hypothetical protein